jgi:tetratricopeptide (TPR) repeat protein
MHRHMVCALVFVLGSNQLHAQISDSTSLVAQGIALDLDGHYAEARAKLSQAIDQAPNDSIKTPTRRALAVSYAFTCDTREMTKYERIIIDARTAKQDYNGAADVSNELARMLLECEDYTDAMATYRSGHELALKQANMTDSAKDLWDFRWEHAQARIAARRGNAPEARRHVTAAKAILDKGTNPDQQRFFPYLTGYVALYTGNYPTAISDLSSADQRDAFILSLLAMAYERSGQAAQATPLYHKILDARQHNPGMAFARPLARRKLAAA